MEEENSDNNSDHREVETIITQILCYQTSETNNLSTIVGKEFEKDDENYYDDELASFTFWEPTLSLSEFGDQSSQREIYCPANNLRKPRMAVRIPGKFDSFGENVTGIEGVKGHFQVERLIIEIKTSKFMS